jgi:general stress protein 26
MQNPARDEDNHIQPLQGQEAVKKLQALAEAAETCFFCTRIQEGKPFDSRPMSIQKVDDEGNFWFLSDKDSLKNQELKQDDRVQMLFTGSSYNGFASVYGAASISQDREKIKELWKPLAKVWFQGGVDDPGISVIKITPLEGHYWDTKHGAAVSFLKMAVSLVTGKTLDDGVEGSLKV